MIRRLLVACLLSSALAGHAARADTALELETLSLIARELELAIDLVERSGQGIDAREQHVRFRYDNLAANLRDDRERVLAHMEELRRVPRSLWNLNSDPLAFGGGEEGAQP